jgi:hypothetical protein
MPTSVYARVCARLLVWGDGLQADQATLRAARARAGVKCDGCGRVGFFPRNCPTCGVQYELDRKARFAPVGEAVLVSHPCHSRAHR